MLRYEPSFNFRLRSNNEGMTTGTWTWLALTPCLVYEQPIFHEGGVLVAADHLTRRQHSFLNSVQLKLNKIILTVPVCIYFNLR